LKPKALIPFVVALAAGGGFLLKQRESITAIERETEALVKEVGLKEAAVTNPPPASRVSTQGAEVSFDWKKNLNEPWTTYGDPVDRLFQKGVETMSSGEIAAALDEIATMDAPEETRGRWARRFLPMLAAKDPRAALERFYQTPESRGDKGSPDGFLVGALSNWAKKDPAAACAWLDGQVKKSDLSNKSITGSSEHRVYFESALLGVLASSDPGTAGKRLMAISENEAFSVISHQRFGGKWGIDPALLAKLTRDSLPAARSLEIFQNEACIYSRNYEDVTGFLNGISATPAERAACVPGVAARHLEVIVEERKLTLGDVDDMRTWSAANQPGSVEKITGKAVGDVVDESSLTTFDEALALVMNYHEKKPDDEVIAGFLESKASRHGSLEEIQALLAKVADPVKRAEMEKSFKQNLKQ
jgi:hypothetical protein